MSGTVSPNSRSMLGSGSSSASSLKSVASSDSVPHVTSESLLVLQTMLSQSPDAHAVPHTMLSPSAPPQSVPQTMLSPSSDVPQTMLSPSSVVPQTTLVLPAVPQTMLS